MISMNCGGHAIMGKRSYMEDRYGILPDVAPDCNILFVADGHGGSFVAEFIYDNLEQTIKDACRQTLETKGTCLDETIESEIEQLFLQLNKKLESATPEKAWACGSTLVVAFIYPSKIVIANCGDSKALWVNYENNRFNFTQEHNANNEREISRVQQAGGYVWNNRLFGMLSVFRSLGDFQYGPVMVCTPDVYIIDSSEVDILVLCTDGIYETITEKMMTQLIQKVSKSKISEADKIARVLVNTAVKMNSSDNITSLVSLI